MTTGGGKKTWQELLQFPLGNRMNKPRTAGLTMIIDKGLGLGETRDLLNLAGGYIDFFKLGFGTSALYENNMLEEKIHLVRSHGVDIYPGGTFLEVAILQDKLKQYLTTARDFGFTAIEVSDGTIDLPLDLRAEAITAAVDMGFKVLSEVGKKDPNDDFEIKEIVQLVNHDLSLGAAHVIVEGRESGKAVGLYDKEGNLIQSDLEELVHSIGDPTCLIWEAPIKDQQQELIIRFGPNVNFGNINPHEVLALEALRVGLRADTLKAILQKKPK
ncbi:phosphosulfolactate synthase [Desulforamulus reducens MI-1]|uniref:Phosphosulfolactate synthase n=1 Tax=Desulforamulus reducens (strain ATCC BAA-1160 / DSM 100696 / MI-1) TaxID=349161 RepID=A4J551_DESRM|nr:phosphosulfolactate synthase [Desulforamulus reducens]ABO50204.1 phosphosulfolactate synthase [Desulforamulus reducens MI-1]